MIKELLLVFNPLSDRVRYHFCLLWLDAPFYLVFEFIEFILADMIWQENKWEVTRQSFDCRSTVGKIRVHTYRCTTVNTTVHNWKCTSVKVEMCFRFAMKWFDSLSVCFNPNLFTNVFIVFQVGQWQSYFWYWRHSGSCYNGPTCKRKVRNKAKYPTYTFPNIDIEGSDI